MFDFKTILFPVDFSPQAYATAPHVREMAAVHRARITLYHAVQPPAPWYPPDGGAPVIAYDPGELLSLGAEQLERFKQRNFGDLPPGVTVDSVNEQGDPGTAVVEFAERNHMDLIMMPTHGCGLFRRLLLGSVTAKVLHDSHCPVWTGVHVDEGPVNRRLNIESIVCAIDLGSETPHLIQKAMDLAVKHTATLRLLHCVPGAEARPDKYFNAEFERSLMATAREEIAALQHKLDTSFETFVEAGSVSKVVRIGALHHQADLLIVGRGVLQGTLGRLRTNTYSIIRDAPCPVLSI